MIKININFTQSNTLEPIESMSPGPKAAQNTKA